MTASQDRKPKARRRPSFAVLTELAWQILTQIASYLFATEFALRPGLAALSALLAAAFAIQIVFDLTNLGRHLPRRGFRFCRGARSWAAA